MRKHFIKAKDAVLIWYANYLIKRAKKAEKRMINNVIKAMR